MQSCLALIMTVFNLSFLYFIYFSPFRITVTKAEVEILNRSDDSVHHCFILTSVEHCVWCLTRLSRMAAVRQLSIALIRLRKFRSFPNQWEITFFFVSVLIFIKWSFWFYSDDIWIFFFILIMMIITLISEW